MSLADEEEHGPNPKGVAGPDKNHFQMEETNRKRNQEERERDPGESERSKRERERER